MKPLFLFVRPPRPLWPFNGPGTAFWPPLAFASMAAALRDSVRDIDVAILDAPVLKMGWSSLAAELSRLRPAYVGIGEEAVSYTETLRLSRIAKQLGARTIAGGCFFAHVAPQVLATGLIDVIVHGEGERTITELTGALESGSANNLRRVAGISFRDGEQVVFTGPRRLIADLDTLPFPAYDLLPVHRYGAGSRNHPDFGAIELSRGCPHACSFCILWRQMGQFSGGKITPHVRTKSAERAAEEVRLLVRRYGRRYLGWVDPCFNAHPEVPRRLAELLLARNLRVGQSAWVRGDYLVRDHKSGALRACADAGLNELYIGVERPRPAELRSLNKTGGDETLEALQILKTEYPQLFTVGSFIYGLPSDGPQQLRAAVRETQALPLDALFFIPLTPLPGTSNWRDEFWPLLPGYALERFSFLPRNGSRYPVDNLTALLCWYSLICWNPQRVWQKLMGLFAHDPRRRSIVRRLFLRTTPFFIRTFFDSIFHRNRDAMYRPAWYEN